MNPEGAAALGGQPLPHADAVALAIEPSASWRVVGLARDVLSYASEVRWEDATVEFVGESEPLSTHYDVDDLSDGIYLKRVHPAFSVYAVLFHIPGGVRYEMSPRRIRIERSPSSFVQWDWGEDRRVTISAEDWGQATTGVLRELTHTADSVLRRVPRRGRPYGTRSKSPEQVRDNLGF